MLPPGIVRVMCAKHSANGLRVRQTSADFTFHRGRSNQLVEIYNKIKWEQFSLGGMFQN